MFSINLRHGLALVAAGVLGLVGIASAQDESAASDAAQANNPLLRAKAFNLHDYYFGNLTDIDEDANQFWLRFAMPFSIGDTKWLMRASLLTLNTVPAAPEFEHETGLGDFNVFAAYQMDTGIPGISFGFGPLLNIPTASEDATGSGKWSAGVANVLFSARSPKFQYGYLLTWQASFAGDDDRDDVNVAAFQPLLIYQLGGGTYLRSTPVMTYDFESDGYSVPLGLGIGQVFKTAKGSNNLFIEPQWSVADDGAGWPEWQVFVGFNMIFQ